MLGKNDWILLLLFLFAPGYNEAYLKAYKMDKGKGVIGESFSQLAQNDDVRVTGPNNVFLSFLQNLYSYLLYAFLCLRI